LRAKAAAENKEIVLTVLANAAAVCAHCCTIIK